MRHQQRGLYVHIPFCCHKCLYCDFPSYVLPQYHQIYTEALVKEIYAQAAHFPGPFTTIYMGGGTPTCLSAAQLTDIIRALQTAFIYRAPVEFTIEANPGTVDTDKLRLLRRLGVNRISFGVQAFQDRLLQTLGRIHTVSMAEEAVDAARQAGFTNISVDLMYGLPDQTLADWRESLGRAVALGVPHISAYGLTVEEGTPFASQQQAGRLTLPDEDTQEAMYEFTDTFLTQAGYQRYEISNYSRPGFVCRHNIGYWRAQPYLGLGAGAHSFWQGIHWANPAAVTAYLSACSSQPATVERLTAAAARGEYLFLNLRLTAGFAPVEFTARFRHNFFALYADQIKDVATLGLLMFRHGRVALTRRGMKFSNRVFAAFLPDAD